MTQQAARNQSRSSLTIFAASLPKPGGGFATGTLPCFENSRNVEMRWWYDFRNVFCGWSLQPVDKSTLVDLAHQARVEVIFRLGLARFGLGFLQSLEQNRDSFDGRIRRQFEMKDDALVGVVEKLAIVGAKICGHYAA